MCSAALLAACDRGDGAEPSTAPSQRPTHTPQATASSSHVESPSPSPSGGPSPTAPPQLDLPDDAPTTLAEPRSAADLAGDGYLDLVPADATVTDATHLTTPDDPIDQITVAWRRGEDVFAPELGLVVWQRFDGDPAWRAVHAFTDEPSSGVLGLEVATGDLTGDGIADLLTVEHLGGSGACGRWRVIAPSPGGAEEVFRKQACDAEIAIAGGALEIREAVFAPDDPHCCPSALRVSTLEWDGGAFVRTGSQIVEL